MPGLVVGLQGLEVNARYGLKNAPAGIIRTRNVAVGGGDLAEGGAGVAGAGQEVGQVEHVESLSPEFQSHTLPNVRHLDQADVEVALPRHVNVALAGPLPWTGRPR